MPRKPKTTVGANKYPFVDPKGRRYRLIARDANDLNYCIVCQDRQTMIIEYSDGTRVNSAICESEECNKAIEKVIGKIH